MNIYSRLQQATISFLALLLFSSLAYGNGHKIPRYELGEGVARTQVDIMSGRALVSDANSDAFLHYNQEQARIHILKRQPDAKGVSKYRFTQFVDQKYSGPANTVQFKSGDFEKLKAKVTVDGDDISIVADEQGGGALSADSKEYVTDYFNGVAQWDILIEIASSQTFNEGESVAINEEIQKRLGFSEATATLNSVKTMWQMEVAEFTYFGKTKGGECYGSAWYTYKEGRPIQQFWSCDINNSNPDNDITSNVIEIRSWQYSDKLISQISPTPLPQLHPSGSILELAYSESLEKLLILSRSNQNNQNWLTYWDSRRRQPILSKSVPGSKLAMSSNEQLAVIASTQGLIGGELQVGDMFKTFGKVTPSEFRSDRKLLSIGLYGYYPVILNSKGNIEIWNLGYNKLIGTYQSEDTTQVYLKVSNDGRVVTSNKNGQAYLYEIKIDASLCANENDDGWCKEASLGRFDLQKSISIPGKDIGSIIVHPSKPILGVTVGQYNTALYNYDTGKYVVLGGNSIYFDTVENQVVTDQGLYDLSGRRVHEWLAGDELRHDSKRQITSSSKNRVFFQSGGLLEESSGVNRVQMRDYGSGELLANIESETKPSITISHKGSVLYTASSENVMAFDLASLQPLKQEANLVGIKRLALDGDVFVLHTETALIAFRMTKDGTTSKPVIVNDMISDFSIIMGNVLFSKDNKIIRLNISDNEQTTVVSASNEIRRFAALDQAGKKFALILNDNSVWLPHINVSVSPGVASESMVISEPDREEFYLTELSDSTGRWNPSIPLIRKFNAVGKTLLDFEPGWDSLTAIKLAGKNQLWAGNTTGDIIVWDTRSGRRLQKFHAHKDQINDLHEMDSGTIASAANDGTIRIWRTDVPAFNFKHETFVGANFLGLFEKDINKRHPEKMATIILDKKGGYIVSGSDGYYTASPGALNRASFVDGEKILDYSRFDLWFNRPDIMAKRLAYSSSEQDDLFSHMVGFRQSRHPKLPEIMPLLNNAPLLKVQSPDSLVVEKVVDLVWSATSINSELSRLTVGVNGVPLFGVSGKVIKGSKDGGRFSIPLSSGRNHIRISVSDSNGLLSSPSHLVVNRRRSAEKPDLYLLAIGVSDYGDDSLDLNYADKDARDIKTFYEKSDTSFNKVHYRTLLNKDATRERILEAKEFLLKAETDDRVIVFFAGHGFLDEHDSYYFGTTDIDPSKPGFRGLSYPELNSLVDGLASRYKLLLLDTCHSGEVAPVKSIMVSKLSNEVSARGFAVKRRNKPPSFEFSLEALQGRFTDLRDATGTIVLSAAGGREYALEKSEWKNGVFTASILKGLKGNNADINGDEKVTTNELREFVYSEVKRLTRGEQKPTTREVNMTIDFVVN